jgi:kynurenine formamidase
MCSPEVIKRVNDRIEREGRPQISRRSFLRLGGLTAAGLAVASAVPARLARAHEEVEVVDLTHVLATSVPTYLLGEGPTKETVVTVQENGFYIQRWTFGEHVGTHVDIPAHFDANGRTVDQYPALAFVSPAVVIDISAKAGDNPDATLDVADLEAWEAANGEIPEGALVCMYSGWEARWDEPGAFRNADADGVQHYPGFSGEAAAWLVENRAIHGIAVDTLSLDPGNSTTFDTHLTILPAGRYGVENIKNLSLIKDKSATVIIGLPPYEAGSGGPCRALALV